MRIGGTASKWSSEWGAEATRYRGVAQQGFVSTGSVILFIDLDRGEDGRWIAEALELPGVMSYGATREEAISNTEKLAIEVIADRIKHGELPPTALTSPRETFPSR